MDSRFEFHRPITIISSVICAACVAAALTAFPASAHAVTAAEAQAEAQTALQSLNNMLATLDEANETYQSAQDQVAQAQATIDEQTSNINEYQSQLSTRARSMYRSGNSSFLDVLFGSATFQDFTNNWDMLSSMNANDAQLVAQTKDAREQIEASKAVLSQQEEQAAEAKTQAEQAAQELQANYETLSAQAADLVAAEQAQAEAQAATAQQQETVPADQITSYDEATGYATLADGRQARVLGYDKVTGNAIVDLALSYVGGSYVYGAEDGKSGTFDCSGLVQYVYGKNGISVGGHNDRSILNSGTVVSDPQPGDICWWDGHVAIYAGDGKMVSADNEQSGITYRNVSPGATYVRY